MQRNAVKKIMLCKLALVANVNQLTYSFAVFNNVSVNNLMKNA